MNGQGSRTVSKRLAVIAILLPLPMLFIALGTPSLWDPDEGRHAEIARVMLDSSEWFLPRLNLQPYLEKLPVFYWILAGCFQTLGLGEWPARLPSALAGLAGIWLTMRWGGLHFGTGTGLFAGVILATAGGYVGASRFATPDSVYSVILSLALFSASNAMFRPNPPARGAIAPYLWLTLATALRGPIALVLAALVISPLIRRPGFAARLRPGRGLVIVATGMLPILLGCLWSEPSYLWRFLIDTNLGSFVGTAGNTGSSVFYYFWILPLLFLPWSVFLPGVIIARFQSRHQTEVRRFLGWWVLVILGAFTVAQAKAPGFILPMLPPLALLTADWAAAHLRLPMRSRLRDPLLVTGALVCATLLIAPALALAPRVVETLAPPYAGLTIYLLWLVPITAPGVVAIVLRNRPGILAWIAGSSAAVLLFGFVFASDTISSFNSLEIPAARVVREMPYGARLLSYGTEAHSLAFYSGRPVLDLSSLVAGGAILDDRTPAALLTKERHLEAVREVIRSPVYVWWEGGSRKVLLANRPRRGRIRTRILLPATSDHGNFTFGSRFRNRRHDD